MSTKAWLAATTLRASALPSFSTISVAHEPPKEDLVRGPAPQLLPDGPPLQARRSAKQAAAVADLANDASTTASI
jgi:hypothetical protein